MNETMEIITMVMDAAQSALLSQDGDALKEAQLTASKLLDLL